MYLSFGLALIMVLAVLKGILIARFEHINVVLSVCLSLLANMVSTVVGIAFSFFGAAPSAAFILLPISFVLFQSTTAGPAPSPGRAPTAPVSSRDFSSIKL